MNKDHIFSELQTVFRSVFQNEGLTINTETSQQDIEQWDSLQHAVLIDAIEKHFKVKFDLMDMLSMETAGDIIDKIISKKES